MSSFHDIETFSVSHCVQCRVIDRDIWRGYIIQITLVSMRHYIMRHCIQHGNLKSNDTGKCDQQTTGRGSSADDVSRVS